MHVCLVCHTEPDVWDGGFTSIDTILPKFVRIIGSIHDVSGATPRVAWCLTSQVAQQRPEPFRGLADLGHEIGVHSHFPAETGALEHRQDLNLASLGEFHSWFPRLCTKIVEAGFAPPHTHVTWMFAYRESMTTVLARAGIRVDCSVCYGGVHYLPGGSLLADSRGRKSGKPYRPAEHNHCEESGGSIVELPVSGGFGSYWEPDGKGSFSYFSPVASDAEMKRQLRFLQDRLDGLSSGEVDVFHIHFHLYEFLTPEGTSEDRLDRMVRMLRSMTVDSRVCFSTASEAANDWRAWLA